MARRYYPNQYQSQYEEEPPQQDTGIPAMLGLITSVFILALIGPTIHQHVFILLPILPDPVYSGIIEFLGTMVGIGWWIIGFVLAMLLFFPLFYVFMKKR